MLFGTVAATVANFSMRVRPNTELSARNFFKLKNEDTQADEADLQELMSRPEILYRFKKNGR